MDKYITGIGISNNVNPVTRRRIAILYARVDIIQQIKVEIQSTLKLTTKLINNKMTKDREQILEQ